MNIQTLGWMTLRVVLQVVFVAVIAAVIFVGLRIAALFIIWADTNYPVLQVFSVIAAIILAVWRRKRLLAKWSIDTEGEKQ